MNFRKSLCFHVVLVNQKENFVVGHSCSNSEAVSPTYNTGS